MPERLHESVAPVISTIVLLLAATLASAGERAGRAVVSAAATEPLFKLTHVIEHSAGYVNAMACTPDGALLAVASDDGRVTLWDTASGSVVRELRERGGAVYAVAVSPDGAIIATAGFDEAIHIWDIASGRERRTLLGHQGWINAVAFSPDGHQLLSAGRDRTVRLWDIETGKTLRITEFPSEVFTVAAGPEGKWFASDKGNSVSIREMKSGGEVVSGIPGQWGVNAIVFSPARPLLISSGYDGVLWVWNIGEKKLEQRIEIEGSPIISLAATGDGSLVALLCTGNATVVVFDTATWKEVARLPAVSYPAGSVVFSADGTFLAAGGGDSPIRIWKRNDPR